METRWFVGDFCFRCIVESEGYEYARYAQFVPKAKLIWEQFAMVHAHEMRFCCPLEIYLHISNYPHDYCIADNAEMAKYADDINIGIRENDFPEERERGLMHWYHPDSPNIHLYTDSHQSLLENF